MLILSCSKFFHKKTGPTVLSHCRTRNGFFPICLSPQQNNPYLLVADKGKIEVCSGQKTGLHKKNLTYKTDVILPRFSSGGKRKFEKINKNFLKFFYEILTIPLPYVV